MFKKDGIKHVKTACMHPGIVRSEFVDKMFIDIAFLRYIGCWLFAPCMYWCKLVFFMTPYRGAQTTLLTALCDFDKLESGGYYKEGECIQPSIKGKNWQE